MTVLLFIVAVHGLSFCCGIYVGTAISRLKEGK